MKKPEIDPAALDNLRRFRDSSAFKAFAEYVEGRSFDEWKNAPNVEKREEAHADWRGFLRFKRMMENL